MYLTGVVCYGKQCHSDYMHNGHGAMMVLLGAQLLCAFLLIRMTYDWFAYFLS